MSPYLYTPVNVSDVARIVSVAKQSSTAPTISLAIKTLAQKTYDNDLPWNLIIFVGSTPTSYNVQAAWDSIYSMSEQGVNVIVVPLTSQIDLLTLEQWPNIFISEYNDNIQVVASNIRNILKCRKQIFW
uniref:Uncharacterized protein n=1 Tax=Acrobeloides nanus TaxID=290746 RepID=A0A914BZA6_9BILA